MEKLTIEATLNEISQAYATLEVAQEECADVVESALDAYFGEIEVQDKKVVKAIKASRRTKSKNIKKLGKAMATGKRKDIEEEAAILKDLVDAIGLTKNLPYVGAHGRFLRKKTNKTKQ